MKCPAFRFAVTALALLSAPLAHAADLNWYLGLGGGYSRAKFYTADFSSGGLATDSKKEFDSGYKMFLGYQFNRSWAIEAAYTNLGNFQYHYENIVPGGGSERDDYKVTGFSLSLLPIVPLGNRFSIYGRLGVFSSTARRTVAVDSTGTKTGFSAQASDISPLTGVGMQLKLDEETDVRVEYENYGRVGSTDAGVGRANVQMLSVSAVFKY
jgi:OmpA-OmpF porin, OOP family